MIRRIGVKQPGFIFVILLILAMLAACAPDIARLQRQGNIDQLVEALNDAEDAPIRAEAAAALGELEASGAIDPLIDRLEDQIPAVRQAAALGLCRIQDPRIIEPAIDLLHLEDESVRLACRQALVDLGARSVDPH
jgi:HEAT repeat protein